MLLRWLEAREGPIRQLMPWQDKRADNQHEENAFEITVFLTVEERLMFLVLAGAIRC